MESKKSKAAHSESCGGASVGKSVAGQASRRYHRQDPKQVVIRIDTSAAWRVHTDADDEVLGSIRRTSFGAYQARDRRRNAFDIAFPTWKAAAHFLEHEADRYIERERYAHGITQAEFADARRRNRGCK